MRRLGACFVFLLAVIPATAGDVTLKDASERRLHGNYAEARKLYEQLAKNDKTHAAAAIGLSRTWRREGKYAKSLTALESALKKAPSNADLLAEKADLLFFRGRWEDAKKAVDDSLKNNKDQFLAHWVLARLHRDRGELKQASEQLRWFIRTYSDREFGGKPITDPNELLLVGLAAVERARRDRRLNDQFQFVLTEVWGFAVKKHKNYWPAEYERGKLFQEKYSYAYAARSFTKVLTINPRAAEALAGKGIDALRRYQMKDADSFADQALKVNPKLPDALRLKADIFLAAGDTGRAMKYLSKAQSVNPRDESTLARFAVCYHLDRKKNELAKLIEKVKKQNPKCGLFYQEFADRLDERKHYYDAEKYYIQAIKLQPRLVQSRNQLGLLYMRLGKEKKARKLLEAGFEADPFNVRVYNSLQVLDHLQDYADLKTAHFHIKFDPKNDKLLAHVVAKYLEGIYEELAEQFHYRPKGPILIEIFNKHTMFSGRVVALPDLHTIGACSGKIIAMCSPRDRSRIIAKPFNWNRVIRHELVHIFNLEQTKFLCPHWFTEGLAVRAENIPMPSMWHDILRKHVQSGKLMNLDNIHLGFIRPRSAEQWHLSYLQSKLYVDYLTKNHGGDAVAGFLKAYGDGDGTAAALQKVCKISKEEFEKGYRRYLQNLVSKLAGREEAKAPTFKELKKRHADNPDDPDAAAGLAEQYLVLGNRQKARALADAALKKKEQHPLASYVKARLLLAGGDNDGAVALLKNALDEKKPNLKVVKLLGKLQFEDKKFTAAAKKFELGRQAQPYDNYWLKQLIRCYRQNGDDDRLVDALKKFAPTEVDDLDSRVYLAKLLAKKKRHAEAAQYAREALEIDVHDPDAKRILLDSLREQGKDEEMREWEKLLNGAS